MLGFFLSQGMNSPADVMSSSTPNYIAGLLNNFERPLSVCFLLLPPLDVKSPVVFRKKKVKCLNKDFFRKIRDETEFFFFEKVLGFFMFAATLSAKIWETSAVL